MNRRNSVKNFKKASGLKPVNTGLNAGEGGYDHFPRWWTSSMNYYVLKTGGGDEVAVPVTNGGAIAAAGWVMEATAMAMEAAADARKLVDTSAPVDQGTESNMLHEFELPASLDVLQILVGPKESKQDSWLESGDRNNRGMQSPEL